MAPEMNEALWFWMCKFPSRFATLHVDTKFTFQAFPGTYSLDAKAKGAWSLVSLKPSGLSVLHLVSLAVQDSSIGSASNSS